MVVQSLHIRVEDAQCGFAGVLIRGGDKVLLNEV